MQKYRHHQQYKKSASYYRQTRYARRTKIFLLALAFVIIVVLSWFAFDVLNQLDSYDEASEPTRSVSTTIKSTSLVFRSQYFQFEAPDGWSEISNQSTDTKYLYSKVQNGLMKEDLKILVNQSATDELIESASRLLQVEAGITGRLLNGTITGTCLDILEGDQRKRKTQVVYETTTMLCDPVSGIYSVIVGEKDGDTKMQLPRPDKTEAVYTIVYRNLTSNPKPNDILSIINSFETR